MSAIRLARAVTGREKVLKFKGAYHGHVDGLLAAAGSGLATQGIPSSPGVPESATAATVLVAWNDMDALWQATETELAAILVEGVPANMGLVPPAPGFLALLREGVPREVAAGVVISSQPARSRPLKSGSACRLAVSRSAARNGRRRRRMAQRASSLVQTSLMRNSGVEAPAVTPTTVNFFISSGTSSEAVSMW